MKLNQLIAILPDRKAEEDRVTTRAYQVLQKDDKLKGLERTYVPIDDEGEQLPPESKRVQVRVSEEIKKVKEALTNASKFVVTQEASNCEAKADIKVEDTVLMKDVPVGALLYLEKKFKDVYTFVSKLPTLDPSEEWIHDSATDCFATPATKTIKTKKIPRNHIKYEATKEHPAQVELFTEDVLIGHWTTKKFSGAIEQEVKTIMLNKVRQVQDAIKLAREEANSIEVQMRNSTKRLFEFIFD
jgi:hypothetical protein